MDKHIKDQLKDIPKLTLSNSEKNNIKNNILDFVEHNSGAQVKQTFQMPQFFLKPLLAVFVLVVATGGGVTLAAQKALPGDFLYGVKVNFNEKVQTWFATSQEAEGQLMINLSQRRLDEAEALAKENKLSPDVEKELKEKFKGRLEMGLSKMEKKEKYLLDLDANLQVRVENLSKIMETTDHAESKIVIEDLIKEIKLNIREEEKQEEEEPAITSETSSHSETRRENKTRIETESKIEVETKVEIPLEIPPVELPINLNLPKL